MNKILCLFFLLGIVQSKGYSQNNFISGNRNFEEPTHSLDQIINGWMSPITDNLYQIVFFEINVSNARIPFVLIWLIAGAIYFTFYMKFINIVGFKHAIDLIRGRYDSPDDKGEVTHLQALIAALSGTLGLGNIAGVAIAISIGGAGATFWMIIAGFIGMSSKFVECALGVKYRKISHTGEVSGGSMYYLHEGLKKKGWGKFGKLLAILFSVSCIGGSIGGGNMIQVNQATQQLILVTGGESSFLYDKSWLFGIVMAIIVAMVLLGGIKSIVKLTDRLVPFMVGIYSLASLYIIIINYKTIPSTFIKIFDGAFYPESVYGGIIGVILVGFRRAAFSNEAGIGSATMAHATAKTNEHISEGIVALIEPFFDTVVVCTITALTIIITNSVQPGITEGVQLTSKAFASAISWFPIILSIAVILFALATMISWSYYGLKAWAYIFGESKLSSISFNMIYCFFVIVGSSMQLDKVFDFGDTMIFAMCFPNVLGMYILAPEIRRDLDIYMNKLKSGEIKKYF